MLRKQYVHALKLTYVRKQILVESGGVFHVNSKVLMSCCHSRRCLRLWIILWCRKNTVVEYYSLRTFFVEFKTTETFQKQSPWVTQGHWRWPEGSTLGLRFRLFCVLFQFSVMFVAQEWSGLLDLAYYRENCTNYNVTFTHRGIF